MNHVECITEAVYMANPGRVGTYSEYCQRVELCNRAWETGTTEVYEGDSVEGLQIWQEKVVTKRRVALKRFLSSETMSLSWSHSEIFRELKKLMPGFMQKTENEKSELVQKFWEFLNFVEETQKLKAIEKEIDCGVYEKGSCPGMKYVQTAIDAVMFLNRGYSEAVDLRDLRQDLVLWSLKAAKRFDFTKKSRTWYIFRLREKFMEYINGYLYAVHVPVEVTKELRKYNINYGKKATVPNLSTSHKKFMPVNPGTFQEVIEKIDASSSQHVRVVDALTFYSESSFIKKLDDTQQKIINMKLEGYRQNEIATLLGCSVRTVKRHISDVRAAWKAWNS